jgi:type I restriction-modification system DNA methylase subunit
MFGLGHKPPQPRGGAPRRHSILGFWFVLANSFFAIEKMAIAVEWSYLQGQAKQPDIGKNVDLAMEAIERENAKRLKGVLPKVYGQQKLDQKSLGGLIDLIRLC